MNRNFTLFLVAALTLSFSFSTVSCKKDNNDTPADLIVGEWYLANEEGFGYFEGERYDYNVSFTKETTYMFMTFKDDGSGVETVDVEGDEYVLSFLWSINNNTLSISYDKTIDVIIEGDTFEGTIVQLDSSTLKLQGKGTDEEGPYEYNMTFKRV